MKISIFRGLLIWGLLAVPCAQATILFSTTDSLSLANPTQLGRLSRNALPQDWSGGEPFPGLLNTTTVYHYKTYSINVGLTPFIQIDFDDPSARLFVSAYGTAYLPNSKTTGNLGFDTNWLGDEGSSGNFTGDPSFFQVIAPINSQLIIVVNDPNAGNAGIGFSYGLVVEGFIDTEYTSPSAVPEPSAILLSSGGLVLLGLHQFRRRRRS